MAKTFSPTRLRIIRETLGLTRKQLADKMSRPTHPQTIYDWEMGNHYPLRWNLAKLEARSTALPATCSRSRPMLDLMSGTQMVSRDQVVINQ